MLDKWYTNCNGDPKSLRKRYVLASRVPSAQSLSLRMFINHELLALRTTLSWESIVLLVAITKFTVVH
jgi:hypothetical protein